MNQLHNICDRNAVLLTFGVRELADVSIIAALAQREGTLTMAQLIEASRLCRLTASARLMHMAWGSPYLSLHWPRVQISGVPMPDTLPLDIPGEATITLTASGWMAALYMGFGRPAVFLPDRNSVPPVLADGRDPDDQAQALFSETQFHWTYQPPVPLHEAP